MSRATVLLLPLLRWAALLGLLAFAGCAGVPRPDAADAERAAKRWPGTDLKTLEEGRRIYTSRCSGCHALVPADSYTPQEWPALVDKMVDEAALSEHERVVVTQFLVTMAERQKLPSR